jgi:Fic family protein
LSEQTLDAKIADGQGDQAAAELRGRREVLQHGAAYHYLCVETLSQPLTTAILLETHRRLMRQLTHTEGTRKGQPIRAGQYRLGPVYAGTHTFPPAKTLPYAVEALFEECDTMRTNLDDMRDPYSLAAKLCYDFVTIHPFEDGNGRMCRLLLNRVLLEYGLAFPIALGFGFHRRAKRHYLSSIHYARASGRPKHLSTIVLASVNATLASFFENQRVSRRPVKDESRIQAANEYATKLLEEQERDTQSAIPIFQSVEHSLDASGSDSE